MTGDSLLNIVVVTLARSAPSLAVASVGLYFAITRRNLHPRVSAYAMVGFACLLLTAFGGIGLQFWIRYGRGDIEPATVGQIISYWNLAFYPVNLVALTAIAVAVFIDRRVETGATQND